MLLTVLNPIAFFFVHTDKTSKLRFTTKFPKANKPVVFGLQNVRSWCVSGRFANVISEIQTHHIDVLCLTETWLRQDEILPDFGLSQAGLNYVSWPRICNKRGGGLAVIYKNNFSLNLIPLPTFDSFDQSTVSIICKNRPIFTLSLVYRPPCCSLSNFITDFDDFFERVFLVTM